MVCLTSCGNDVPAPHRQEGSNRDWFYTNQQAELYIDGERNTNFSQLQVVSYHNTEEWEEENYPYLFDTEFRFKGLVKKNKITTINVIANLDTFYGTTTINGVEYDVTGEYVGNCFADPTSELGVIINLISKLKE